VSYILFILPVPALAASEFLWC